MSYCGHEVQALDWGSEASGAAALTSRRGLAAAAKCVLCGQDLGDFDVGAVSRVPEMIDIGIANTYGSPSHIAAEAWAARGERWRERNARQAAPVSREPEANRVVEQERKGIWRRLAARWFGR